MRLIDRVQVSDKNLYACLLTMGVLPFSSDHIRKLRGDTSYDVFEFELTTQCGKYKTDELARIFETAWHDGGKWFEENPNHPFAYAMLSLWNRIKVQEAFQHHKPSIFIQKGASVAMIDPLVKESSQQEILRRIGI